MGGPEQGELFPDEEAGGTVAVNDRCLVRTDGGHRVILVAGMPVAHYTVGDRMAEAYAMVQLVDQGWAGQVEVARAFACTSRTVRRQQRRFEEGGLVALGRRPGYPTGRPRLPRTRTDRISRLVEEGHSRREVARRLGTSEKAVRKQLRRLGWRSPRPEQTVLPLAFPAADPNLSAPGSPSVEPCPDPTPLAADPNLSASATDAVGAEPLPWSMDHDPAHRFVDRLMASLGLLDDAAPLFRDGTRIPGAGVLLAIPGLLESGTLQAVRRVYGNIGPAFYGLRTTVVALVLLALLRIKRPEAIKEHCPEDLGRLLGLDRAPEVKTLRRKLARLAAVGRATELGRLLAREHVSRHDDTLGFLYVDGHVRVYHGQHPIPKTHSARMRISLPGTTDYWVNDQGGDPLFVVTSEANAGLCRMLPSLLGEVRSLVGKRRITIVFDRGGWSPKLFASLLDAGFDLLTYRKGRSQPVAKRQFHEYTATFDGHKVTYRLADQGIHLLGGKLRLRQITELSDNGHQTPIVTSRRDLAPVEIAYRMFERWRQENFFKYLREEYALDALADYSVEPDDPSREVPNPKWAEVDAKWHAVRERIARIERQLGAHAILATFDQSPGRLPPGLSALDEATRRELAALLARALRLGRRRKAIPRRIPVRLRTDRVVKLAVERKHLTNLFKMVAYRIESDLLRRLAPHYKRADDEGRTLVQTVLGSPADLQVTDRELRVTLAPLSSPHRSRAAAALCQELNARAAVFPGTRLRLRYAVADPT